MNRALSLITLFSTLWAASPAAAALPSAVDGQPLPSLAPVLEQVTPSVVNIYTRTRVQVRSPLMNDPFFRRFFNIPDVPRERVSQSLGSGVIVDAENGFVVTNNHVIEGADDIAVTLQDGRSLQAELVGRDPDTDLAVVRIPAEGLQALPLADSSELRVGDFVVAVGNPFGLGGTVTTGIISARGRDIGSGPYDDFLQIDAAINKGNSGGPAFNLKGELVGVNTAIFSPSGGSVGIGFAIPAHLAGDVVADLKDDGNVTRGWLGVVIQPVTQDIADSMGLDEATGVIIADVQGGSPASKAGLRNGDTILTLDGKTVESPRDLARKVAATKPGAKPTLELVRNGERITKTVTIAELPGKKKLAKADTSSDEPKVSLATLGLELSPSGDEGVAVVDVDPEGPAAEKGLRPGDHILEVSGIEVQDPESVASAIERADRKGRKTVLLLVRSGENQRFVAIPLKRV